MTRKNLMSKIKIQNFGLRKKNLRYNYGLIFVHKCVKFIGRVGY